MYCRKSLRDVLVPWFAQSRSSFHGGGQASGLREAQLHGTTLQSSDPTKATGQSIPDTLPFGVILKERALVVHEKNYPGRQITVAVDTP